MKLKEAIQKAIWALELAKENKEVLNKETLEEAVEKLQDFNEMI